MMQQRVARFIIITALLAPLAGSSAGEAKHPVTIVPAPAGESLSDEFEVNVEGQAVPVYRCRVSAVPLNQVWPSKDDQRGTVRDVVIKDIAVTSRVAPASRLEGLDAAHGIDGVVFENMRFNGRAITNAAAGHISIGAHVRDVKFIAPAAEEGTVVPP